MCDTLGVCLDSYALFGKNSDRSPNEAQVAEFLPARKCAEASMRATYIELPQVRETRAVLLSRPTWMWGAEIGVNEAGVAIGNEAVFTKGGYGGDALTGMDLVRLALERADDAQSAVETVIELLETHGQGGNCGFDHTFRYDNSFLIMDRARILVLETCGKQWALCEQSKASISNRLTIERDAAVYGGGRCNFRRKHSDPLFTFFSGAKKRQNATACALDDLCTEAEMFAALRTHEPSVQNPFARGTVASPCMHYGALVGDHTTASMVVRLDDGAPTVFLTGASLPCVSLYKPYRFGNPPHTPVSNGENDASAAFWQDAERYRRALIGRMVPPEFFRARDELERSLLSQVCSDAGVMDALLRYAVEQEATLYARFDPNDMPCVRTSAAYRARWRKKNEALFG